MESENLSAVYASLAQSVESVKRLGGGFLAGNAISNSSQWSSSQTHHSA